MIDATVNSSKTGIRLSLTGSDDELTLSRFISIVLENLEDCKESCILFDCRNWHSFLNPLAIQRLTKQLTDFTKAHPVNIVILKKSGTFTPLASFALQQLFHSGAFQLFLTTSEEDAQECFNSILTKVTVA